MHHLKLTVLSLRYSSWSMRPWLVLTHAGASFETETIELPHMLRQGDSYSPSAGLASFQTADLPARRELGSVHGLFPVLRVDGLPIHESLAICEYAADAFPEARLWPADPVERACARAICCEMVSGFRDLRGEMSSHLFARVPAYVPGTACKADISRVFELWTEALQRSGGPFLFGAFGIADAMYFPVLGRFRTYGIAVPDSLSEYARSLESAPAVSQLLSVARTQPKIPIYDDYVRRLGGEPDAALGPG